MMPKYYEHTSGQQPSFNKVDASQQLAEEMPLLPTKRQVCDYYGYYSTTYFFEKIFFQMILPNSKYTYNQIKFTKRLPAGLAQELYEALGWKKERA